MAKEGLDVAVPEGQRSIGRLLFLIGSLVSLAILLLSLFLWFRLSDDDAILDDMGQVIEAVSNETVATTEGFLASAERSTDELTGLLESGRLGGETGLELDAFFFDVLQVNDEFDAVFLGESDGSFTYVSRLWNGGYRTKEIRFGADGSRTVRYVDHDGEHNELSVILDRLDEFDPRERPWYELALETPDDGAWTSPYVFFSSGLPGVTRARAVTLDSGKQAVLGIDIRLEELSTFMLERRASPNGASFIIDRELNVVAHPDSSQLTEGKQLVKSFDLDDPPLTLVSDRVEGLAGATIDSLETGSVDGVGYHFASTSLANNPQWIVSVTAPDEDFLARVRDDQERTRLFAIVAGLLSVALLFAGGNLVNVRYRQEREFGELALASATQRAAERDAAEEKLSRTVQHLARSNAELEQYAYATAHDLRTPLRAIGGYAELLLLEMEDDAPEQEELHSYATRIVDGYERMCATMDSLLEHAKASIHEPVKHSVQLGPIANDVLDDFAEELDELGAEVVVSALPFAAVHPVAMRRVLQNLVGNAIQYRHPERPLRIDIHGEREGEMSTVRVTDNGIGISPEKQDEVFRLFNRVSTDDSGSGVGLALVRKLVEEHRGSVRLESTYGSGSTFHVTIPAEPVLEDPVLEDEEAAGD